MQYKCIIFDLDGTLLDTLETLSYYCNETLKAYGFAPYDKNDYKYMVGKGAKNLVESMLRGRDAMESKLFNEMYKYYIDLYNADTTYKTTYYDGILPLLDALLEKKMHMAVLSNKPNAATVPIIKNFFGERFSVCFGAREGVPIKPDPTAALEIVETLGFVPSECLYVGDTGVDMETGKNAGFFTIGVLWGFREREELEKAGADFIAAKPLDILKLL